MRNFSFATAQVSAWIRLDASITPLHFLVFRTKKYLREQSYFYIWYFASGSLRLVVCVPVSKLALNMFTLSKSKDGFSSLREDSEDCVEHDQMLDHYTYVEERNRSRSQRFWSSNIPWMFTTIALSIYIIASSIYHKRTTGLCNPTDLGK
jgi:hypothetical protein